MSAGAGEHVESVSTPTVTVVICVYTLERWNLLVESIRSVVEQSPAPHQVVVVSDHHLELFGRLRAAYPDLHVIESQNRPGLSGARNTGLAVATGDVVAFLDDDAAALPGWLAELTDGFAANEVQGVGGSIEANWVAGRPWWFPAEFDWVVGCSYRGQPRATAVRNLIGANMSFRKATLLAAGGFREGLGRVGATPVGGEETELCIRIALRDRNARFVIRPMASVRHTVPPSRGTLRYFVRRCWAEGVSKAVVSRWVGRSAGLATERRYVTRSLPAGVLRGARDALRGDRAGVGRAIAIALGLLVTMAGYGVGAVRHPVGPTHPGLPAPSNYRPT